MAVAAWKRAVQRGPWCLCPGTRLTLGVISLSRYSKYRGSHGEKWYIVELGI